VRRENLDLVYLNRTLGGVNLLTTMRKPFDVFAEHLLLKDSRGDSIFTEPKIGFSRLDWLAVA